MLTYQDYLNSSDKIKFINDCINEFKNSDRYKRGINAWEYFCGRNVTILKRMKWFYNTNGIKQEDLFKANNQVPSAFFPKIIKQENSYLLANGVTIDSKVKKELGRKFDNRVYKNGLYALLDGVSWAYCHLDDKGSFCMDSWRGIEFIPLLDERTGTLMAGIRFWQLDTNKPIYIEFYESDGITELIKVKDNDIQVSKPKKNYKNVIKKDILGERVDGENWSILPIFPLYCDETGESRLTISLMNQIDMYDKISSDLGNNLEDTQDVYWVLKNYGGEGMEQFLEDYKYYRTISLENDGDATAHTIEVPYEARKTALEILRKEIYATAMALDNDTITGSSLTTTAIKSAMQDLDLKTDAFEINVIDFIENILNLYNEFKGINKEYEVKLIRRTLINDTEMIDNIYKFRNDIDLKTALTLNPYVSENDVDEIMERLEEENANKFSYEEIPIEEEGSATEEDEKDEQKDKKEV